MTFAFALHEVLARRVAEAERVPRLEAREAVEAAADILEWRYDYSEPGHVMHLARLIIHPPPPAGWRR
jgi:hypothetical protein